jgi:hypothetical protein
MGLLGSVNLDLGSVFSGIGTLAKDIRSAITGDVSPEKKAELAVLAANLEAAGQLAQTAINQAEAGHASVFVAGWRPAIGWICASVLAWNFIGHPLAMWATAIWAPHITPPALIAADSLFEITMGMLGLGGLRSWEKLKGLARQ